MPDDTIAPHAGCGRSGHIYRFNDSSAGRRCILCGYTSIHVNHSGGIVTSAEEEAAWRAAAQRNAAARDAVTLPKPAAYLLEYTAPDGQAECDVSLFLPPKGMKCKVTPLYVVGGGAYR